jgi:hypothetical protein
MLAEISKIQDNYLEVLNILGVQDSEAKIIWHTIQKYSMLNIVEEAMRCKNWWEEKKKKLKRPRQAYVNWLKNALEFKLQSPEEAIKRENEAAAEKTSRMLREAEASRIAPDEAKRKIQAIRDQLKDKLSIK